MRPTPTELIDAIAFSLKADVAEELQSGWAKRVLASTLNALDYLKLRWEHGLDILAEDNADLLEVLGKIDQLMASPAKQGAISPKPRGNDDHWADAKPSVAIKQMEDRNLSMRQSLVDLLEQLDGGDAEFARQVRLIVHPYIQRQLSRDSKLLVPYIPAQE